MPSFFHLLERAQDDPILGLPILFNADPRQEKVNLGIGSYITDTGKSYLFKSVEMVEKMLAMHNKPKDYLPMEGDLLFLKHTIELNLGSQVDLAKVFAFQTIGGTGALSLAAEFLAKFFSKTIAISSPSWSNHVPLFRAAGFDVCLYPYYDIQQHKICFDELKKFLLELLPHSIILLQNSCHNPTGADFTHHEWQILMELIQEKKILPLFDNAYQGFGTSLEDDVYPIRLFHENQVEMLIATANSKNFGLYGERIGALIFSLSDPNLRLNTISQLRKIIRSHYSSPPIQGAKIVGEILSNTHLKKQWEKELDQMRIRINNNRHNFSQRLGQDFTYMEEEKGFFSLLGISEEKVLQLRQKYAIYMPLNGRINLAGLTSDNISYTIESIAKIL